MGNNGSSHFPSLLENDGQLWRCLGNYGGVQAFFGFARRKAMGNNGASHFPILLNDDGQLWRRLGNIGDLQAFFRFRTAESNGQQWSETLSELA